MRSILPILCLAILQNSLKAESIPEWDVYQMCADADAIVLGEQKEGDNVTVVKWLRPPLTPIPSPETIIIAHLGEHSKDINGFISKTEKFLVPMSISTRRFVAFLSRHGDAWQSMATYTDEGYCGSCGLVWIDQGQCYRYIQAMNPGPYDLTDEVIYPDAIKWNLKTEKDLLAAIDVGMADAVKWREALAIKDGPTKASALASYAMASTSPEQPRKTYRPRVRKHLGALGKTALPALRHQIVSYKAGDSLDEIVLAILDIGAPACELAPDLLPLLQTPDRAYPGYVLSALGAIGDKSAVPQIKPFSKHPLEYVRESAAKALKKLSADEPSTQANDVLNDSSVLMNQGGKLSIFDIVEQLRKVMFVNIEGSAAPINKKVELKKGYMPLNELLKLVKESLGYDYEISTVGITFLDPDLRKLDRNYLLNAVVEDIELKYVAVSDAIDSLAKEQKLPMVAMSLRKNLDEKKISLHLKHITIREALNSIARAAGLSGWNSAAGFQTRDEHGEHATIVISM